LQQNTTIYEGEWDYPLREYNQSWVFSHVFIIPLFINLESSISRRVVMKKLTLLFSLLLLFGTMAYGGKRDPIAVISQVKGKVEYTKNGRKWKKVRRNKFLFDGYRVRTGPKASGTVTNQRTGRNMILQPNSLMTVSLNGVSAQKGSLSEARSSSKLISGLMKRFSKSQTYTTVRRSLSKGKKLDAVKHIILTEKYPCLVWENLGNQYRYELKIGGETYNIPPSKERIIRIRVKPFSETKKFFISAFIGNQKAADLKPLKRKKVRTIHWLNREEQREFDNSISTILETYPDNAFMLGSFFEKKKMWVAAMDQYKKYLADNPDEIEMTPYLFRVYKRLKLTRTYKEELNRWTVAMKE
jgi:hypothetical protein